MKMAFALFNYFPYGGLQRNCINIARACHERGHEVHVFAGKWDGPVPAWLNRHLLPWQGLSNHARAQRFTVSLKQALDAAPADVLVGFNRMPDLDVYYAADPCFVEKSAQDHGPWFRLTRRYRTYAGFERAVYGADSDTQILAVAEAQIPYFQRWYGTPAGRFHVLPPGIQRDRMAGPDADALRASARQELKLTEADHLVLMVGSGFRTKGVDRAIQALADLPEVLATNTRLLVIGSDDPVPFERQARQLGVADKVQFLAGRDDIPRFLQAADGLIHPAYHENTGNVLLEAVVAGLPVLATDVCGYAPYIDRAHAGLIHRSPFDRQRLAQELATLLTSDEREMWRANGIRFGQTEDLYHRAEFAASVIETTGARHAARTA